MLIAYQNVMFSQKETIIGKVVAKYANEGIPDVNILIVQTNNTNIKH